MNKILSCIKVVLVGLFLLVVFYSTSMHVSAIDSGTSGATVKASDVGYSFDKIRSIFVNGVCQLTRLAIVVAVLFLLYVGYQFMSAGGAEKNITNAKENLKYVFIGIVIIVGVDVIIATIGNAVAGSYSLLDCSGSGSVVNVNGTDSGGQ